MAEVQTAALWDGVEEPGELVWVTEMRSLGTVDYIHRVAAILDELSGAGPQRRAWACYARLEPYGA